MFFVPAGASRPSSSSAAAGASGSERKPDKKKKPPEPKEDAAAETAGAEPGAAEPGADAGAAQQQEAGGAAGTEGAGSAGSTGAEGGGAAGSDAGAGSAGSGAGASTEGAGAGGGAAGAGGDSAAAGGETGGEAPATGEEDAGGTPAPNERWRFYRDSVNKLHPGSFAENAPNLVGVVGFLDGAVVENKPGEYNDTLALAWKDEKGAEQCLELKASCDPGGRPNDKKEIHLFSGQYKFRKGKVNDGSGTFEGLVPSGKVKVYFDSNGDGRFHPDDKVVEGSYPQIFIGGSAKAAADLMPGGQIVAGGRGAGSPWAKAWAVLSKAKGPFVYTLVEGTTLLDPLADVKPAAGDSSDAAGAAEQTTQKPPEAKPEGGTPKQDGAGPKPQGTKCGPNPNDPASNPPKLLGGVPMAKSTGIFWPVVPKGGRKPDKLVYYQGEKKKNGWGKRHFGADRTGSDGNPRVHAGIDLAGNLGDTVVACEDGTVVNWYPFYHGVYALIVQNDSGTVINYGEVDERSKAAFGLKKGRRVKAGEPIAYVGKMIRDSMLHFEMFVEGTTANQHWRAKPHPALLNPTQYLLDLAEATAG